MTLDEDGLIVVETALKFPDGTIQTTSCCPTMALIPRTGQESCWDSAGDLVDCVETGQDGDFRSGIAWPNPRFKDNDDGTITDNLTGLTWLKNANCFGERTWPQALNDCNTLENGFCGLSDGSMAGQWRLPNKRELDSLVHLGFYDPSIPNTTGTGQWSEDDPFQNVQSSWYWSSNTRSNIASSAWSVGFLIGASNLGGKSGTPHYVWPVKHAK